MMEDKIIVQKLIDYIKQDLELILQGITKKYEIFNVSKNTYSKHGYDLVIEFDSFKKLYEEFCFKFRYIERESINPQLIERFNLFEKIFFKLLEKVVSPTLHLWTSRSSFSKYSFYFRLLYVIFKDNFFEKKSIQNKFQELLDEWNTSLGKKEIYIQILVPLPRYTKKEGEMNDISIKEKINVKWGVGFDVYKKRGDNFYQSMTFSNLIIYNTQASFDLYRTVQEHNDKLLENHKKFEKERIHLFKIIREIVCTFYLCGVEFKYKRFYYLLPWWFEPDYKLYSKIAAEIDHVAVISQNNLIKVKELYPKLIKSQLFYDDNLIILSHHYKQLINRIFSPDVVLDAFIILEFILTGNVPAEVTYRISINAGFFLANDFDEFESIYRLMRDLYRIRSALIHGNDWLKRMDKLIRKYVEFKDYKDILHKLKKLVNFCIIKLINLKRDNPNILKELDDFYIIKSSNVIKK